MRQVNRGFSTAIALVALSTSGAIRAQAAQPIVRGDIVMGLSFNNAPNTLKHVQADLSVAGSGIVTDTAWDQPFIQSVEFDNLNGFRHNARGNLLGLNFGSGTGGTLYTFATNTIVAGQTTPANGTLLFSFNGSSGGSELARVGGLSVNSANNRIAVTSSDVGPIGGDQRGKLIVLDYTASNGSGTGAAAGNYRSIEIPGLRIGTGTRTSNTTWLSSNEVLVAGNSSDLSTSGDLYKVTVANDGTLSSTKVADNLLQSFNLTVSNVTYEPTVSPYVYVSGSGFDGGTINKLIVVDPNNNFAPVTGLLDYSPSATPAPDGQINTLREMAFDAKGNLLLGAYFGSQANAADGALKSLLNARNPATLASQSNLISILEKQQTGQSSSFNGLDLALTNVDYVNADVLVTIGNSGEITQEYFGNAAPAQLLAKLAGAKIVTGGSRAVGYSITPGVDGGTFHLLATLKGDSDLNKAVNFDDLLKLAQKYGTTTGADWSDGDFDYNAAVNFDDLLALAQNYGQNAMTGVEMLGQMGLNDFAADWALALAMVPEPTTCASLALAGLTVGRRRRHA